MEIFGSSGVAVAWGLHYYLKTYCNVHISWEGNQIELPQTLPDVRVKVTSNDRYEVSGKEDETTRKPQGKNMISHILYEAAIAEFTATSMKNILPNYVAIWFPDKIYSEHFKNMDKNAFVKSILLLCNLHLSFSSTLFNSWIRLGRIIYISLDLIRTDLVLYVLHILRTSECHKASR